VSWSFDPHAIFTDAFTISWSEFKPYMMSRSVCLGNLTGKEIKLELRSENQFWAGQKGTIKIAFSTLSLMIFNITFPKALLDSGIST
jgi:hypothetical protein